MDNDEAFFRGTYNAAKCYINELSELLKKDKNNPAIDASINLLAHEIEVIHENLAAYAKHGDVQCKLYLEELNDYLESSFPSIVPEIGIGFFGYKLVTVVIETNSFYIEDLDGVIEAKSTTMEVPGMAKLYIPTNAKRLSTMTGKCRSDSAEVVNIQTVYDNKIYEVMSGRSPIYNEMIIYEKGSLVIPDEYDGDRWNQCSHGIHFFISPEEAISFGRSVIQTVDNNDNMTRLEVLCKFYKS